VCVDGCCVVYRVSECDVVCVLKMGGVSLWDKEVCCGVR
jgi:hypothetical protein